MKYFHTYKLNQMIKIFLFILTLSILLFLSKENFESVKNSTTLFLSSVFPSLFPFILFTTIILNTNLYSLLEKLFGKILSKIFHVPPASSIAILTGFLCGFPMGAKSVETLYETQKISKQTAIKLLFFVNNCNPSFILSTIGSGIFYDSKIGWILFLSHYLSAILIGIVSSRICSTNIIHKTSDFSNIPSKKESIISTTSAFDILKKSLNQTFLTLLNIFGFMTLFNLLFSVSSIFLNYMTSNTTLLAFLSCILEVTKGCKDISLLPISSLEQITFASFALGFSGFCIIFQIYSVLPKLQLKLKNIVIPKLIQGILSAIITYILLRFTNIYSSPLASVFRNHDSYYVEYIHQLSNSYILSTIILILGITLFYIFETVREQKK